MIKIKNILMYLDENHVDYNYYGNNELIIDNYCPLNLLHNNCMTWIRDASKYNLSLLDNYNNLLVICNKTELNVSSKINYILTDNPHSVFFSILAKFYGEKQENNEIDKNTSVIETKFIGKNVKIGHFCTIGKDVKIGDNVVIKNNISMEGKVIIGDNTVIYSGVVIGMDGYGYYDNINNQHLRVPHLGGVIIGKNVEIGSNTCIAKGCLADTIINDDVKIDNLCHIAHNVVIGRRSKIIAMTMLAGSSIIGEDVWVAPCSAIKNQVSVGDNSLVGMGAVVTKDVETNIVVAGVPAKPLRKNI